MDRIGQYGKFWTILTKSDNLDNSEKNGQYENFVIGQKVDKSGQNWTLWTT